KYKAAQLVRANWALKDACLAYGIPLLSGKDSMYVDGSLVGTHGERHKVSGLATLQFTAVSVIPDVTRCRTLDFKFPGDLIYLLGLTRDELGGSEYYDYLGYLGLNVPETDLAANLALYRAWMKAHEQNLMASAKALCRGGLAVAVALSALAAGLGAEMDLGLIPAVEGLGPPQRLFSESTGRFLVTVRPNEAARFEQIFAGLPAVRIGEVRPDGVISIKHEGRGLAELDLVQLRAAFNRPFGRLI
ncbi:MAG: AIR synthase-related protein, partial [Pseudomonadota bacterium]